MDKSLTANSVRMNSNEMHIVDALQRNTAAKIGVNGSEKSLSNLEYSLGRTKSGVSQHPKNQKTNQLNCLASEWNLIRIMKCFAISTRFSFAFKDLFINLKSYLRSLVIKISITTDPTWKIITYITPRSKSTTTAYWVTMAKKKPIGFFQSNGNLQI